MFLQKLCVAFFFTILLATKIITSATKIRLPLIHHHSISSYHPHDTIVATLWPEKLDTLFLVEVLIGEPPVPQLLAMDTGSEIIWVCTTCGNDYDPNLSSTYETVTCSSTYQCFSYYYPSKCRGSQCAYNISYIDGSYVIGVLAREKFTFETSTGGVLELPDTMFGSGRDIKWKGETLSGIFGLNPSYGEHSLVVHVGKKFSYCIGNISDPSYKYNHLILGDGAIFEGSSTPLTERSGKYYLYLEGVSVGHKQLQINADDFGDNTLIDSGSTLTFLTRGIFEVLKEELKMLLDGYHLRPVSVEDSELCYLGNLFTDLKGFPTVTLQFANDASLDLHVEALFRMLKVTEDAFCLNIAVSPSKKTNIIGVYAQQYYNFAFDFNAMTFSFLNIECSLLE